MVSVLVGWNDRTLCCGRLPSLNTLLFTGCGSGNCEDSIILEKQRLRSAFERPFTWAMRYIMHARYERKTKQNKTKQKRHAVSVAIAV
jgi:hypothetical protein